MDAVWTLLQDELLKPVVIALAATIIAVARAWVQKHAAVLATAAVEKESRTQARMGIPPLPSEAKKKRAMRMTADALPLGVRPFSKKGLGKLVEKALPAGRAVSHATER